MMVSGVQGASCGELRQWPSSLSQLESFLTDALDRGSGTRPKTQTSMGWGFMLKEKAGKMGDE